MARQVYQDVAAEANLPISNRGAIVKGRGGKQQVVRMHHLLTSKLVSLENEIRASGRFVNPYGHNRLYGMIVNSLIACGENIEHTVGIVFNMFKKIASDPSTLQGSKTMWDRYSERAPRNENRHLEAFPRFLYNVEILQRLGGDHPWGFKLAQLGACIDVLKNAEGMILLRLRTGIPKGSPVSPINMNRKRKCAKTVHSVPSGVVIGDQPGE